jgi:hypothetical protein
VAVTRNPTRPGLVARLTPVRLRTSATIRLKRLAPTAVFKTGADDTDVGQLVVPLAKGIDPADALVVLLAELVPAQAASLAS